MNASSNASSVARGARGAHGLVAPLAASAAAAEERAQTCAARSAAARRRRRRATRLVALEPRIARYASTHAAVSAPGAPANAPPGACDPSRDAAIAQVGRIGRPPTKISVK